jgi:hypothetical protein
MNYYMKSFANWGLGTLFALSLMGTNALAAQRLQLPHELGLLRTIDLSHTTITVTNPRTHAVWGFVWNDQTRFFDQRMPIIAKDLKIGERILVRYVSENHGNMKLAKIIRVLPAHHAAMSHMRMNKG